MSQLSPTSSAGVPGAAAEATAQHAAAALPHTHTHTAATGAADTADTRAHAAAERVRRTSAASYLPLKICVFGSGSFGTAMGTVLARNGHEIWILTRRPEVATQIAAEHKNPAAFPDIPLPFNVTATTDAAKALAGARYIVHAIPVQASFEYLAELKELIPADVPIINTSKGLHTAKLMLMSDVVNDALGRHQPFVSISGPTFAEELMRGFPTGAVAASVNEKLAADTAHLFTSPTFRVWTSNDVVGVEVAGALKNVYALAAGSLEGLGLKMNTTAMLCTRAIAEMNKLARALGSSEATLAGLAGIGDLMLTAFGKSSRNRTVGVRLGRGEKLADILATMTEVAEGVSTAPAALRLAQSKGIPCPIIEAVVSVLEGKLQSPLPGLMALLAMPVGEERIL